MKKILIGICLALLTQQCDKEDEKDNTSNTEKASNVADCAEAVTAFTTNIQPAIDQSCLTGCHVKPGGRDDTDLYFVANNAKENRKILAEHDYGYWKEAGNLYQKIGPTTFSNHSLDNTKTVAGHGGSGQSSPTGDEITKWTTAEAGCK